MNTITGIIAGQYGEAIALQVLDDDGVGIDLTPYTTVLISALAPDNKTTKTFSSTGGGDSLGNFSVIPSSSNTFDTHGTWLAQVQLTTASILAMTIPFQIEVERQI